MSNLALEIAKRIQKRYRELKHAHPETSVEGLTLSCTIEELERIELRMRALAQATLEARSSSESTRPGTSFAYFHPILRAIAEGRDLP